VKLHASGAEAGVLPNGLRMSFYSDFAEYYEMIFPFRKEVHAFLRESLPETGRRILDAGCGTGHYCGRFAAEGFEAIGVDLDPVMVEAARRRYPAATFHCLDMVEVADLGSSFDLIVCIGNTAAHLTQQDFAPFIQSVKGILRPGGRWLFQVVNWDFILSRSTDRFSLKTIEVQGATFEREYREVSASRVRFCNRLRVAGRTAFEGEVWLYPIRAAEVLRLHGAAGFSLMGHYADFHRSPFDPSRESGSVYVFSG
jgi:SAM-dependent methyltransferase